MREDFSAATLRLTTCLLPVGALISVVRGYALGQWPLTAMLYMPLMLLLLWRMPAHRWRVAIITLLMVVTASVATLRYGFSAYGVNAIPLFGSVLLFLIAGPRGGWTFGALALAMLGLGHYLQWAGYWQPPHTIAGPGGPLLIWLGSIVSVGALTVVALLLAGQLIAGRARLSEGRRAAQEENERLNRRLESLVAEQAGMLQQSELRAQGMLQGMPAAMFVTDWSAVKAELDALVAAGHEDPGAYLRANPLEALRLFALKRDIFANRGMLELFDVTDYDQLNDMFDPVDEQDHELYHATDLLRHHRIQFRSQERRRSGRPMVVDWSISVAGIDEDDWSRVCGVGVDVTESATRERLMQTTLSGASEAVSLIDRFQRVTLTNPKFHELLGYPEAQFPIGTPYEAFIRYNAERGEYGPGDVDRQVSERLDEMTQAMERGNWQYARTRPNGTVLSVTGRSTPDGGFVTVYTDVTRQEQDRAELQQVVETITDGVMLLDADGRMLFANRRMFRFAGLEVDPTLYEQPVEAFIRAGSEASGLDAEREIALLRGLLEEVRAGGPRDVIRHMDHDRSYRISARMTASGGCVVAISDVTALEQARTLLEDSLVESDLRLKRLVDAANVAIVTLDEQRRMTSVNPFARTLFRFRAQVAGDPVQLVAKATAEGRDAFGEVLDGVYLRGERRELEVSYPHADGSEMVVMFHVTPLVNQEGAVTGCWLIGTDVSQLRSTERHLQRTAKLATIGEMATGIGYELNQPLHIIKLAAQNALRRLARDGERADLRQLGQKLDRVVHQVDRASVIIEHMRQFGRIPDDELTAFDPVAVVRESMALFAEQVRLAEIDLQLQSAAGLAAWGNVDVFSQVMANLLANSIERLRKSDGAKRLTIACRRAAAGFEVEFTDNGGGMSEAMMAGLFSPVQHVSQEALGGWLGLSVSRDLLGSKGGTIDVANEGEGTRITVLVPDAPGASPANP